MVCYYQCLTSEAILDVHFCSFVWTRCQSHQVAARSAQGSSTCQWERNESAQCSPVLSGPHPEQFVNFRAGQVFRPCSTLTFGLNKTTRSVLALLCWRRIHVDHEGPLVTSRSNVRCPMSDHTCAPAQFSHSDSFRPEKSIGLFHMQIETLTGTK